MAAQKAKEHTYLRNSLGRHNKPDEHPTRKTYPNCFAFQGTSLPPNWIEYLHSPEIISYTYSPQETVVCRRWKTFWKVVEGIRRECGRYYYSRYRTSSGSQSQKIATRKTNQHESWYERELGVDDGCEP